MVFLLTIATEKAVTYWKKPTLHAGRTWSNPLVDRLALIEKTNEWQRLYFMAGQTWEKESNFIIISKNISQQLLDTCNRKINS